MHCLNEETMGFLALFSGFPTDIISKSPKKLKRFQPSGGKNLISQQLIKLRKQYHYSQRHLACLLQLAGYDIDKVYVF